MCDKERCLIHGHLQRIYAEDKTVDGAILQICSIKPIQAAQQGVAGAAPSTRYRYVVEKAMVTAHANGRVLNCWSLSVHRLTLSDGEFYLPAMLATQLNNIATDNLIDKFSVVKLSKYLCNTVHNKKYVHPSGGMRTFVSQIILKVRHALCVPLAQALAFSAFCLGSSLF